MKNTFKINYRKPNLGVILMNTEGHTEKIINDWNQIEQYIWKNIEKKWSYFCPDDLRDLADYVRLVKEINVGPQEFDDKINLLKILQGYIDYQSLLSANPLREKYEELDSELIVFEELGLDVNIDWYVASGRAEFKFEESQNLMDNLKKRIDVLKESFGFKSKSIELIANFSGEIVSESVQSEVREFIEKEIDRFIKEWEPVLKEEIQFVNKVIDEVITQQVYNENNEIVALKEKAAQ